MAYQISEDTKKRVTKCPCNFECLNNKKWDTCSIEKELSGGRLIATVDFRHYI